jgi:hypothetical protein
VGGWGGDGGGGEAEEDSAVEDGTARSEVGGVILGGFLLMWKINVLVHWAKQFRLMCP